MASMYFQEKQAFFLQKINCMLPQHRWAFRTSLVCFFSQGKLREWTSSLLKLAFSACNGSELCWQSAVTARSQKDKTCRISRKISVKHRRVHWILLPHPLGEEQSWVFKVGLGCGKRSESSPANPAKSHCDANDKRCVFLAPGPADPDSLWSGFKEAEDYISFVCLL